MKNKIILTLLNMLWISLILISTANAFGVVDITSKTMYPGEIKIVNLNVQNRAGATEDVIARIEFANGTEIATLEKTDYVVPADGEIDIPITIKIPEDAQIGTFYTISFKTKTIPTGAAGGVAMGIGMTSSFNVDVIAKPSQTTEPTTPEQPEEKPKVIPIIIAAIVILAIIIIAIILKRRKRN